MRTRQRLIVLTLDILLSGSLVLRRMASAQAYLTPQTTCAASHERRLRRALNAPLLRYGGGRISNRCCASAVCR